MTATPNDFASEADEQARVRSIAFLNWAHAIDHFVILIFPTLVIGLQGVYGRSYAEMIALGTASFFAFGLFALPAGWLADRWSRRNMMVLFFFGCGVSMAVAAVAPTLELLAVALFMLGVFAAIYHPVGMPMLVAAATNRGRTLAFNGVCGNVGAALAAGITALLATWLGWRGAFLVPAALSIVSGVFYMRMVPDDGPKSANRNQQADVPLSGQVMATMFGLFVLISVSAGLVFNIISVALPKIVDERIGDSMPLLLVGGVATAVFLCGALAQLTMGRLVEKYPPHWLFAGVAGLQFVGVLWASYTGGLTLLVALALTMAAVYGQVTVNDVVIARYTADAWRGRIYAVRYFFSFASAGVAVSTIALLYGRGGFDHVLLTTAALALACVACAVVVAVLATGVEKRLAERLQAAE